MEYIQALLGRISYKVIALPFLLVSIILHELAHGYAAYLMGDPTAKREGRLSLNPLKHLDLWGTLCMIFAPFGWAKPVPVNPYQMKKPKLGMALCALAGPVSNLLLAFVSCLAYVGFFPYIADKSIIVSAFSYFIMLNCTLAVFNLIPFPPLDGSKILFAVLPERTYFKYMTYERYAFIVLIVLVYFGVFDGVLSVVTGGIMDLFIDVAILIFG